MRYLTKWIFMRFSLPLGDPPSEILPSTCNTATTQHYTKHRWKEWLQRIELQLKSCQTIAEEFEKLHISRYASVRILKFLIRYICLAAVCQSAPETSVGIYRATRMKGFRKLLLSKNRNTERHTLKEIHYYQWRKIHIKFLAQILMGQH